MNLEASVSCIPESPDVIIILFVFCLSQGHQRAVACESQSKETAKNIRHNVHIVECDQSSSDDESTEVYAAEMVWPK